jgi:transcriptional regulator with PAS, ATPase and Fis domain
VFQVKSREAIFAASVIGGPVLIIIDCKEDSVAGALASGAKAAGAAALRWSPEPQHWPDKDQLLLICDGDTPAIVRHAADLRARQIEPKRTLVRTHETQNYTWIYHDLPIFASIAAPQTEGDATAAIRRLTRARQYDHADARDPVDPESAATLPAWQSISSEAERLARIAAKTDLKILLVGETGTGKNTFAARIHAMSGRSGPFVSLNCSALPETLIESELFGVEPGAFTGAHRSRPGKFELADQGTLFLDEIDSLPLHLQTKLLGAIQDSGTTRLGDHRFRPSHFRLVTASQTPLARLVAAGTFRADLMHRVAVVEINLPPVRRLGSMLIAGFEDMLSKERARLNLPNEPIEPSLYMALLSHDWPGNFRELAAAAQRCAVGLPPLNSSTPVTRPPGLREQMAEIERLLMRRSLTLNQGNLRATSDDLGLPLETLRYRLRLLGLSSSGTKSQRSRS